MLCHGNICRSPMAEFVMKKLISDAKLSDKIYVESAATSTEEIGNPVYHRAKDELVKHGIQGFDKKKARQVTIKDYDDFDLLVVMDGENLRGLKRIIQNDADNKIHKLLEYADGGDIEDPWYTRNFDKVYSQIEKGCKGLLQEVIKYL